MIKNYFKIAWRNLVKNRAHSFINISGLSVGMAVALLIGLWIRDELSFNKYHKNYTHIARIMMNATVGSDVGTQQNVPYITGSELRAKYGSDFKYIVMASATDDHILSFGDKKIKQKGNFMEPDAPGMLTLHMLSGTYSGLKDPFSIMLSASAARSIFGDANPVNKLMKIDNKLDVKVTGVYEDLPDNSDFKDLAFISPWELHLINFKWIRQMQDPWGWNAWYTYVQIADNANMAQVSKKIKDLKQNKVTADNKKYHWELFLQPMSKWHLYSEFKNGKQAGGLIEFVWLFGIIGVFVLLLACINFMNLSTARSEKRAKEVGIRKAIGSVRKQLILQFFSESLLVAFFAFLFSLLLTQLALPFFNQIADKKVGILWGSPLFWFIGLGFSIFTGIIAGSYPALYLSSFQPVKVLKGTFRVGRLAALPRKILVVMQFSVSVILIIGTIIVFRQIQFAKNRPIGYDRNGLIVSQLVTPNINADFNALKNELLSSGAIAEMALASSPTTDIMSTNGNIEWQGKDPALPVDFPNTSVSYDYGKTVGWEFIQGRDFSKNFSSDSDAFIINQTAVNFMNLKNPIGATISWGGHPYKVIGVVKDMIMDSPYEPVKPSIFNLNNYPKSFALIKLNPLKGTRESLDKITGVFNKYDPAVPFDYKFVDEEYAKKFGDEERIGKLASAFAVLAIFISCLGLFGMASFMAEQRIKEIGVRKVLGASVFNLWRLLSKDFVGLVLISLLIATPVSYYFMHNWLQNYTYRSNIAWWIFVVTGMGAITITLLTVSYQSIKAALANPIKSLKTE